MSDKDACPVADGSVEVEESDNVLGTVTVVVSDGDWKGVLVRKVRESDELSLPDHCCVSVTLSNMVRDSVTDSLNVVLTVTLLLRPKDTVCADKVSVWVTVDVNVCVAPDSVTALVCVFFALVTVTSDSVTVPVSVSVIDTVSPV